MEIALSWAFVSAGAVTIFWLKMHYGRKEQLSHGPKFTEIQEQTEALNADLQSVYDELADKIEQVNERLDFAERLLSKPRELAEDPAMVSEPEVTPV